MSLRPQTIPSDSEVRQRIEWVEDYDRRLAFMYQLLIAGRISEVCGKFAPRGDDCWVEDFEIGDETVPGLLFAVKTAKRGGKLRGIGIPLTPEYEPWTKELQECFEAAGNNQVFKFSDNQLTSIRILQAEASEAFKGLVWVMKPYIWPKAVPPRDVEHEQFIGRKGEVKYRILQRWRPFSDHTLRKRRTMTLQWYYKLDGFQHAAYGGWTEKSQVETLPDAMSFYTYLDIQTVPENKVFIKDMADSYFSKLLKRLPP